MPQQDSQLPADDKSDLVWALWMLPVIDVPTAATLTGVSSAALYRRLRATGEVFDGVPGKKSGRRYLVPTEPLRNFLCCTSRPDGI